jgi:cyclic pyranopterin phosphate synthase
MTAEEIGKIVKVASGLGMSKIKLTGGEPLLRGDIVEVAKAVVGAGASDVSLATNGIFLAGLAESLADAGLNRVNISLDSLNEKTYERITGKPFLREVVRGIDAAIDAGLSPVKLNMVVLRGLNETEIDEMIEFAGRRGVILQLIELLRTPETTAIYERFHVGLEGIEEELRRRALRVDKRLFMQARRKYVLKEAEVEVVNPMHNSEFCTHCTRLRLTPDGRLKPCLMLDDGTVDVVSTIRSGTLEETRRIFMEVISKREPYFKRVL